MFFTTTCLDLFTFSFHFYFLTSSLRAAHLTHSVFLYYLTISQVTTLVILQLEFHQDFLISGKHDQICFFLLECKNKCSLRPLTRGKIKIRQMASPFVWLFLASGFSFISIWIVTVPDCIIHATWSMQRRVHGYLKQDDTAAMNPQSLLHNFLFLLEEELRHTISKVVLYTGIVIIARKNPNTKTIITQIKLDIRRCINSYKTSTSLKLLLKRVTTVLKTWNKENFIGTDTKLI